MNNQIHIRPAMISELATLKAFEQHIVTTERPFNEQLKKKDVSYYDLGELIERDDACVMVAEEDGQLVASGSAVIRQSKAHLTHDKHAFMGFMFVAASHRGKGLNQMIIDALVAWSKSQGINDCYLTVYAENQPAIKAYEKSGFVPSLIEMKLSTK